MYEVKNNGDGSYSIYENDAIVAGAKIKSIKQNYIPLERMGHTYYQLTDQEATVSLPDGNGDFQTILDVPIIK